MFTTSVRGSTDYLHIQILLFPLKSSLQYISFFWNLVSQFFCLILRNLIPTYQSIDLWIIDKKGFSVPLLVLHERLNVHVKVLRVGALGRLRG